MTAHGAGWRLGCSAAAPLLSHALVAPLVHTTGGAVRVVASFRAGLLGLVSDETEFVIDPISRTTAFRAASSSPGVYPFSSSNTARKRNRERLLRVRKRLFERFGWSCGCPPDENPFAAAKCALTCEP